MRSSWKFYHSWTRKDWLNFGSHPHPDSGSSDSVSGLDQPCWRCVVVIVISWVCVCVWDRRWAGDMVWWLWVKTTSTFQSLLHLWCLCSWPRPSLPLVRCLCYAHASKYHPTRLRCQIMLITANKKRPSVIFLFAKWAEFVGTVNRSFTFTFTVILRLRPCKTRSCGL